MRENLAVQAPVDAGARRQCEAHVAGCQLTGLPLCGAQGPGLEYALRPAAALQRPALSRSEV